MNYDFSEKNIGVAFTGSFCTYENTFQALERLSELNANLYTIFSNAASSINSRFGSHDEFIQRAKTITKKEPIFSIQQAEPIGPKNMFDILVIAPCTGNTLSKLANGITDTPVLMAAKSHLRNNKPLVISLATNDALGMNLKNIGVLLNTKNIFFVPFGQDNHELKPNSMIAHIDMLPETIHEALSYHQIQPVIKSHNQ